MLCWSHHFYASSFSLCSLFLQHLLLLYPHVLKFQGFGETWVLLLTPTRFAAWNFYANLHYFKTSGMLMVFLMASALCWFIFWSLNSPSIIELEVYKKVIICANVVLATFKQPIKLCVSSCKMQLNCNSFLLCCLINFKILLQPLYLCWPGLSIKWYQKASVFPIFSVTLSA